MQITINLWYLAAFVALSCGVALTLARVVKRVQTDVGDASRGAWEAATQRPIDFGPNALGAAESQRLAAVEADEQIAICEAKGRCGP